jgi:hypothetical protein
MNRHDRVRVNYSSRPYPDSETFPTGKEGVVLETVGPYAVLRIDGSKGNTTVELQYLEVIKEGGANGVNCDGFDFVVQ